MTSHSIRDRSQVVMALAVVVLCGCGGGSKTVTERVETVTVTTTGTISTQSKPPEPPPDGSGLPSRQDAEQYAERSYVDQEQLGRRIFKVEGPAVTVTADDDSQISAFGMVLADSGDGTGEAVLLFRDRKFLGWASDRLAIHLLVESSGNSVAVKYGNYQGNDPFCCPSSTTTVRYSWNGERIVADRDPPLAYGKQGDRLRLSG